MSPSSTSTTTTSRPASIGSGPPSPTTTTSSVPSEQNQPTNNPSSLDDIFGSSPPLHPLPIASSSSTAAPAATTATEPSDLPSLPRQHVTAGYRDGVSVAKNQHVQRGFDGGYPIGAELGMRVGVILGALEGLTKSLRSSGREEDIVNLYKNAKKELSVQSVFGGVDKFGDEDGEGNVDVRSGLRSAGDAVVTAWEERVRELLGHS